MGTKKARTVLDNREEFSRETFYPPCTWMISGGSPSALNGVVNIYKYKISVERIEESREVYVARLNQLWAACKGLNEKHLIIAAAQEMGAELDPLDCGLKG